MINITKNKTTSPTIVTFRREINMKGKIKKKAMSPTGAIDGRILTVSQNWKAAQYAWH